MPELPEVETIRIGLEKNIRSRIISEITVLEKKQLIGDLSDAVGKKIVKLHRSGKYLGLELSNGFYLNIHLKMTGQLLFAKDKNHTIFKYRIPFTKSHELPNNTTRIIIKFTDGALLFYNDLRKFGWIKITKKPEFPNSPDILSSEFSFQYLLTVIKKTKKPIKTFLLDQQKLAGIGNIYANEILFTSKIHPLVSANTLTKLQTTTLYQTIIQIIKSAIKNQGTSTSDKAFILPNSNRGTYQTHLMVYDRENKPCKNCGEKIIRLKHHGRSSFLCPSCQKM